MAIIETFTLKPHEMEIVQKRADAGSGFYKDLLVGYETHGSLTKKQYDTILHDKPLSAKELAFVTRRAEGERADESGHFFIDMLDKNTDQGFLTKVQLEAINKSMQEEKDRQRVAGVPVSNRIKRDGKAVCKDTGCKEFATKVIGDAGYCPTHFDEKNAAKEAASA